MPRRVTPRRTLSIARGNALQLGGLLGATALAWYAGRRDVRGTGWMVASRLLAYFSEHAFSHWLVGRAVGIRFTGYALHGTSHPQSYPPGARPGPGSRDVRCRHRRDRRHERGDPGLLLAAWRARSAGLLSGREPVERSDAPERVAAPRRGPAPGMARAFAVNAAQG
jgi:hypothetical protein